MENSTIEHAAQNLREHLDQPLDSLLPPPAPPTANELAGLPPHGLLINYDVTGSILLIIALLIFAGVIAKMAENMQETIDAPLLLLAMMAVGGAAGWVLPDYINQHVVQYFQYYTWAVRLSQVIGAVLLMAVAVMGFPLWVSGGLIWLLWEAGSWFVGWLFSGGVVM